MSFGGGLPLPVAMLANNLFSAPSPPCCYGRWCATAARTYRDNAFFMVMLPAFLIAKYLMLYGNNFSAGYAMAIGLFRLAFLVMLERTLTGFMKAAFQTSILRQPRLDMPIAARPVAGHRAFPPRPLTAGLSLALAVLLAVRFVFWKPQLAFKRIDIGIMYVGYLAIVGQLLIEAWGHVVNFVWIGSVSAPVSPSAPWAASFRP